MDEDKNIIQYEDITVLFISIAKQMTPLSKTEQERVMRTLLAFFDIDKDEL